MATLTPRQFQSLVIARFRFLEDRGFRRAPAEDVASSVGTSVVYVGRHLGFRVGLDVRDQAVDVRVVKVADGEVKDFGRGGYSRDLYAWLIKHAGYRGGAGPAGEGIEGSIEGLAQLLERHGESLLADAPDVF